MKLNILLHSVPVKEQRNSCPLYLLAGPRSTFLIRIMINTLKYVICFVPEVKYGVTLSKRTHVSFWLTCFHYCLHESGYF